MDRELEGQGAMEELSDSSSGADSGADDDELARALERPDQLSAAVALGSETRSCGVGDGMGGGDGVWCVNGPNGQIGCTMPGGEQIIMHSAADIDGGTAWKEVVLGAHATRCPIPSAQSVLSAPLKPLHWVRDRSCSPTPTPLRTSTRRTRSSTCAPRRASHAQRPQIPAHGRAHRSQCIPRAQRTTADLAGRCKALATAMSELEKAKSTMETLHDQTANTAPPTGEHHSPRR